MTPVCRRPGRYRERDGRTLETAAHSAGLDCRGDAEAAGTPTVRVAHANAAARVQPRREGYINAVQIYPFTEGALYQVYASPGEITEYRAPGGRAA